MNEILNQKTFLNTQADTGLSLQTAALTNENPAYRPMRLSVEGRSGSFFPRPIADVLPGVHVNRMFILIALILWAGMFVFFRLYYPTYVVTMNGTEMGMVRSRADFEKAVERVEKKATQVLGYDYTLNINPEYRFTYTLGARYIPSSAFDSYLTSQVSEMTQLSVLTVNGKVVGAAKEAAALNQMLQQILDSYRDKDTTSVSFADQVSVSSQYVPLGQEKDIAAIKSVLTGNAVAETTYTVVPGDTFSKIAKSHNMTVSQINALNPGIHADQLKDGQLLTVQKAVPFLSVRTAKTVTYAKEIPYQIQTVEDSTMYKGDSKVVTAGVNGAMQVTANQVLVNGKVTGQTVAGTKVLAQPVTQVVKVGTAVRPLTAAKGYFIWPTTGHITSPFGYRSIFGAVRFHSGIDIANSDGTKILAADGGTVTFVGYKGSYGNLVIINHGDGRETYYAHCSSVLVSEGSKVCQGQLIAKTGRTGRATGNHLHFEVHIDGTVVNPINYLS